MSYTPEKYWEERLNNNFNLIGVGYHSFNEKYNKWLYKAKVRALNKAYKNNNIELEDKNILDIGCGTGFFVEQCKLCNVKSVFGIDITQTSISKLQKNYSQYSFKKLNIGEEIINFKNKFDIISIFDVFYHITDDEKFNIALQNIKNACHKDSYLLLTDQFGSKNNFSSQHAKFRSMHEYKKIFQKLNFEIIDIIPMYFVLNYPTRSTNKNLTRLIRRIGNRVPYIYYLMDYFLTQIPLQNNNLKLLIAKPKSL
jgi:SAM-dependent methyltransferase